MLDPGSFDTLPEEIVRIFQELEDAVIADICRRLRQEGYITATAEIRISSLLGIGMSDAGIRQAITKALGISEAKLEELYQAAAKESQRFDAEVYKRRGQEAVKPEDNDRLQTAIRAQAAQTQGEFDNFTGSLGFSVLQAGRRVFLPVSEGYQHALNRAQVEIISGQSPLEAMKRAVRELAKSGLRTVDYASGRHDQLDVAVRRATVTGLHQVSDKVSDEDQELFESPLVEVSAHGGARDTGSGFENHKRWQGKVYYWREKDRWGRHDLAGKYPDFVRTTGYGDVRGFGGANCRHSKRVFVEGVSRRMYTTQHLKTIDKPPFAYKGIIYSAYEATQRQRELERMQRYYKRILIGYDAAGIKPDDKDYQDAAIRLQVASQEYRAFSAAAGLIRQPERAQVEGFGRGQAARARTAAIKSSKSG